MEADESLAKFRERRNSLFLRLDRLRGEVDEWFDGNLDGNLSGYTELQRLLSQKQDVLQEIIALERTILDYLVLKRPRS